MSKKEAQLWDVAVVGGGPAGMMAAGRAAELGAKVILIEKNDMLGKKLLITGGGRCNVTNAEFDTRTLLAKFKDSDKFLFSAFSQWDVKHTLDFFHTRNMPTKVENEKRVFPQSNKAQSVWDVLVESLKKHKVAVLSNSPVISLSKKDGKIEYVELKSREKIYAKSFVLATGGKSRPETGSTGDGFMWLKKLGHKIVEQDASLVPVTVSEPWVRNVQGISLPNVKISILQNDVRQHVMKGKILFTHFGVSGPTILNLSADIRELLKYGEVIISLDVLPVLDHGQLNTKLQEIFDESGKKKFKNSLSSLVPSALATIIVELSGIDPELSCSKVSREQRLKLIEVLKGIELNVTGLLGVEKAIITSGGVSLAEIDFKTMASKLYPNLFIVGDMLNIDRPSGGYSLQLCWTTGYVAGSHSFISK